jgi:hypothetical protein
VSHKALDVGNVVNEKDILTFIQTHIGSVYTLEVLLRLKGDRNRVWQPGELIQDLRSSRTAVTHALRSLVMAGLVVEDPADSYRLGPASPEHDQVVEAIEKLYADKPTRVVKAIIAHSDEKLRAFSDAFKLRD